MICIREIYIYPEACSWNNFTIAVNGPPLFSFKRFFSFFLSKDRLPYYERIYKNIVSSQPQRYERQHPLSPTTGMPITEGTSWGNHELNMFHDLVLISRGQEPKRPVSKGQRVHLYIVVAWVKISSWLTDFNILSNESVSQRPRVFDKIWEIYIHGFEISEQSDKVLCLVLSE